MCVTRDAAILLLTTQRTVIVGKLWRNSKIGFIFFMMALTFFFRYATLSVRILKLERAMRDGFMYLLF